MSPERFVANRRSPAIVARFAENTRFQPSRKTSRRRLSLSFSGNFKQHVEVLQAKSFLIVRKTLPRNNVSFANIHTASDEIQPLWKELGAAIHDALAPDVHLDGVALVLDSPGSFQFSHPQARLFPLVHNVHLLTILFLINSELILAGRKFEFESRK